ncbi:MAG: WD40 repeat domain-containing protein, partial [Chloroflexota bacterium]
MSKNDFLYALRDDLPKDFSESLREQLKQLEQEPIVEARPQVTDERGRQTDSSRWLLAVASFAVLMAGLVFLLSTERQNDVAMNIATLPPTITNHGDLNPETVSQLTPITTLGNGVAQDMMLSDDGDTLVLTGYGVINLHDANNLHAEPHRIVMDGFIRLLDVTDDNMVYGMISNHEQGYTSLYEIDGNTGEIREMMQMPYVAFIYKEQLSLAGNRLAIIACIPDDPENTIRCLSEDYQLQVYDITTGELGISIPVNDPYETPMDISHDGQMLVYGDMNEQGNDFNLYAVDLMNGQSNLILTRWLPIQYNWVRFSPDDEALLIQSNDRLIQYPLSVLLDAETPVDFDDDSIAERSETQFLNGFVEESNFHPERAQLIAKGSSAFQVYDIKTQHTEYQQTQVELRRLYHWAILPDGESFIGLDESGVVMRYSFPDAEVQDTLY